MKTMEDKSPYDFEMTMQWAGWCPIHNGAPPPYHPNGYKCQRCGKYVCAMDIYSTSKGMRCGHCLKDIPEKELLNLKPIYNKESFSEPRKNYLKLGVAVFLIQLLILLLIILKGLEIPFVNQIISSVELMILIVLFGIGLIVIPYYFLKFRKENKEYKG